MGKYIQNKGDSGRSVEETLNQAEDEHYLDCPNADFPVRVSALLLDAIFLSLLITGTDRVFGLVQRYFLPATGPELNALIQATEIASDVLCYYLFFIWSTTQFGGSPAKLILGLRVIHQDTGEKLSTGRALVREVIGKILLTGLSLGTGFLLPLFRPDSHALHDLFSKTAVKKVRLEK